MAGDGGYQSLSAIKHILWKALKRSGGVRSKVNATNEFKIDEKTLEKLGDRTIIFNNQINRVDIQMHQDIYAAIQKIDALEYRLLKKDFSLNKFIEVAFDMGIPLNDLLNRIEYFYIEKAMQECENRSQAAKRIGLQRTSLVMKLKKMCNNRNLIQYAESEGESE